VLDSPSELQNDLQSYWLPFTPNRDFKAHPRILVRAEGMHYWDDSGRKVLDAISGLWCVNAGHGRKPIVEAIRAQAGALDYAPSFHFAHPKVLQLAARLTNLAPKGLDNVFFCNSGSEAADTAMKIARGYFSARAKSSASNSSHGRGPITASISAACRWVGFPTIVKGSDLLFRVRSIACRFPTMRPAIVSPRASFQAGNPTPTNWRSSAARSAATALRR